MILSLQISAFKVTAHHKQLSPVPCTSNTAQDAPALLLGREGGIRALQLPATGSYEQLTRGKPVSHEQYRAITESNKSKSVYSIA